MTMDDASGSEEFMALMATLGNVEIQVVGSTSDGQWTPADFECNVIRTAASEAGRCPRVVADRLMVLS